MNPSLAGPVLVVGCGLMGTSTGLALRRREVEVYLDDLRRSHVEVAESRGAGSGEKPTSVAMVVIAVPPDHVGPAVVDALREWPEAVVTDLSSIKAGPLAVVRAQAGADAARYVGGHPMAGSERSGPVAASEQLFDGRAWAVTPSPDADPTAVEQARVLATTCGATVIELSPDEHDAAVARVSHLPHVMAVLAAAQLNGGPETHLALSGQGLRDVTRIAGGDPRLWRQILGGNASHLGRILRSVRADIDTLLTGLESSPDEIVKVLERGVHGTDLIPGKHGAELPAESTVYVHLPDRPGELARLFGDAGESGVNIEDLRIDHDPARPVGLVEVVVASDRVDTLIDALGERGWRAHR
ncbi:prephenate dehydrogenase [Solicola gregarius]|uniref:Prephenate dehydrogenase n=1 Tax=Solicola gregarius TaxID=2908642 RepID=A0AA46TGZ7_9ACTN|nr:prephenate dehydrogenase [Solicola gregarius]UYM05184.1 prephenate dehydrogenase [Solicola gregarius]